MRQTRTGSSRSAPGRTAQRKARARPPEVLPAATLRCVRKFRRFYPGGFTDQEYIAAEREYKESAHRRWLEELGQERHRALNEAGAFQEAASAAIRIESRTNLLFSFEKMAVRDAVRTPKGARLFSEGLYDYLYGGGPLQDRFARWAAAVGALPRRQTRVLTWPVLTVFPFIVLPRQHIFLKPTVTKVAAGELGLDFAYSSKPLWPTYASLLSIAAILQRQLAGVAAFRARDMIDIQSFLWVQGSDEYEEGGKHAG